MRHKILCQSTQAMWYHAIQDAENQLPHCLDDVLKSYLILLLAEYMHRPQALSCNIAQKFLIGIQHHHHDLLRESGDICLLTSGLFPLRYERSAIDPTCFISIGKDAYLLLSQRLVRQHQSELSSLYHRLHHNFISLIDILLTMREITDHQCALSPLYAQAFLHENSQYARHVLWQYQHPDNEIDKKIDRPFKH